MDNGDKNFLEQERLDAGMQMSLKSNKKYNH